MEVFVAVVENGGFSAAGRLLNITPSAVSKIIGRLESRLGTLLLVRTTRQTALTPAGSRYYESSVRILGEIDRAEAEVFSEKVSGKLRITTTSNLAAYIVAPAIISFQNYHPNTEIELNVSDEIVDIVVERHDIAVRLGNLSDSELIAVRLGWSRVVTCASAEYLHKEGIAAAPAALKSHRCIPYGFQRRSTHWRYQDGDTEIAVDVNSRLAINSAEALKEVILSGAGIGRLSYFQIRNELISEKLVEILANYSYANVQAVTALYTGKKHIPERVHQFKLYLKEFVIKESLI